MWMKIMVRFDVGLFLVLCFWKCSPTNGLIYCGSYQFQCDIDKCIPNQWHCDGEHDCHDKTDEVDCEPEECDENTDFECATHEQCVPLKFKCDGDPDCLDGSDENDCANVTCGLNYLSCGLGNVCIHSSFFCDGHTDCPGGLDEKISTCKNRSCKVDEFQCQSGDRCISERWRCDGDDDCDDQSDEKGCPEPSCGDGHFQCQTNTSQCIPEKWHCDGDYDCYDRTDEKDCPSDSHDQCDANEFFCAVSHECIRSSWVCDNDVDCADGSDEKQDCQQPSCKSSEFQCRNFGNCIPGHWKCDGRDQCGDSSDEEDCPTTRRCNPQLEFDCNGERAGNVNCIPLNKVCDHSNDCGAYEDEAPEMCNRNQTDYCETNKDVCQHNCMNTLFGYYCNCRSGFNLLSDNKTCEDVDECKERSSCSHVCINEKGGFKCICNEGYEIDAIDRRTCLAKGEPSLIFSNRHELREFNLRNGRYQPIQGNLQNSRTLDFDIRQLNVFWSEDVVTQHTISRMVHRADGTVLSTEVLVSSGIKSLDGMAYDWIHSNLYWTDSGNDRIDVLGLETRSSGRWRTTLVAYLDDPKAIVLDPRPQNYAMYWTECGKQPRIMSASLDGSNAKVIIPSGSDVVWPNGLTIDFSTDHLYWIDMKLHLISSLNIGGGGSNNRKVVLNSFTYLRHPFAVTVFEDTLYWSDWQSESILKVNKFLAAPGNVTRVLSRLSLPMDLKVLHQLRQPIDYKNVCDNQCSHICLPTKSYKQYTCACPNSDNITSYKLNTDEKSCIVIKSSGLQVVSWTTQAPSDVKNVGVVAGLIVGVVVGILLIVAVVSYCVIKKYRRRNIKIMNFDNPVYRKRAEDQICLEKNEYLPSVDLSEANGDLSQVTEPLRLSCDS